MSFNGWPEWAAKASGPNMRRPLFSQTQIKWAIRFGVAAALNAATLLVLNLTQSPYTGKPELILLFVACCYGFFLSFFPDASLSFGEIKELERALDKARERALDKARKGSEIQSAKLPPPEP